MRVALVTGASGGIGRACAVSLAEDGWAVAVGYRSSEAAARETLQAVEEAGGKGTVVRLDVTDEGGVREAFRTVAEDLGPVAGLVNNAGMSRDGLAIRYPTAAFDRTMETNARGAFLCSREALRDMLRSRWGRIVNVSSAVALRGNPGQVAYAASKAAMIGMTRSLAREVGSRGITVNAVCPGVVITDMTEGLPDERIAALVGNTPAGRPGTPAEVGAAIRFLLSEEAGYVNGAVLAVDGGLTA
ncbi:MAG: 3-oxoacyl-ACP reductase FabG [Actinobacteria bacterium]|nr:3-oxoacyl-ACP reductase FabG [Actinomycetota bacterium]